MTNDQRKLVKFDQKKCCQKNSKFRQAITAINIGFRENYPIDQKYCSFPKESREILGNDQRSTEVGQI